MQRLASHFQRKARAQAVLLDYCMGVTNTSLRNTYGLVNRCRLSRDTRLHLELRLDSAGPKQLAPFLRQSGASPPPCPPLI